VQFLVGGEGAHHPDPIQHLVGAGLHPARLVVQEVDIELTPAIHDQRMLAGQGGPGHTAVQGGQQLAVPEDEQGGRRGCHGVSDVSPLGEHR
jgi:hypothetical protein